MPTQQEFDDFKAETPRRARYRMAQKTFRYPVYQGMEAIGLLLLVTLIWNTWSFGSTIVASAIGTLAVILALLHHASTAIQKPWLALAAGFEAFIVWALYAWWLSNYFQVDNFWAFCAFVFAFRFVQRGEHEVNAKAFFVAQGGELANQ